MLKYIYTGGSTGIASSFEICVTSSTVSSSSSSDNSDNSESEPGVRTK